MTNEEEGIFRKAVRDSKVPILVLDQKWHRLFALSGKPDEIKAAEQSVNELLIRQGKLNNEVKDLRKVKAKLMQEIVENMQGAAESQSGAHAKKLDQSKRLLDETNERIEADEDELMELPRQLKDANNELMFLTMTFSYDKLRTNSDEAKEIADWIADIRVQLKKNIIRKQNREINNREIYSYMHDIFGRDVMDLFDAQVDTDLALSSPDSAGRATESGTGDDGRAAVEKISVMAGRGGDGERMEIPKEEVMEAKIHSRILKKRPPAKKGTEGGGSAAALRSEELENVEDKGV